MNHLRQKKKMGKNVSVNKETKADTEQGEEFTKKWMHTKTWLISAV